MTKIPVTALELLASYWLNRQDKNPNPKNSLECLRQFSEEQGFSISDEPLREAANHLDAPFANGDIGQWVVSICFFGHPLAVWNFMIDAVAAADSDNHLQTIATNLGEHLLAHYGSLMHLFEKQARRDAKFGRILTGVWRHRMSDDVWMQLRAIQSVVIDPLTATIPLENGIDYMADHLTQDDRATADKGVYARDAEGRWKKRQPNPETGRA